MDYGKLDASVWNLGLAAVAAVTLGCGGDLPLPSFGGDETGEGPDESPIPASCEVDSDCGAGGDCVDGQCRPVPPDDDDDGDDGYDDDGYCANPITCQPPYDYDCNDHPDCDDDEWCYLDYCYAAQFAAECEDEGELMAGEIGGLDGVEVLSLAFVDLDEDGAAELVLGTSQGIAAATAGEDESAVFAGPEHAAEPNGSLTAADFDGDGLVDVALLDDANALHIYAGDGVGELTIATTTALDGDVQAIAALDFDDDGAADVALRQVTAPVEVLRGDGEGGLSSGWTLVEPHTFIESGLSVGDADGDGVADVFAGAGVRGVLYLGGTSPDVEGGAELNNRVRARDAGVLLAPNAAGSDLLLFTNVNAWLSITTDRAGVRHDLGLRTQATHAAWGNLDGDGVTDVVFAGEGPLTLAHGFSLDEDNADFRCAAYHDEFAGAKAVAVGDHDGDGHDEIALIGADDAVILLRAP